MPIDRDLPSGINVADHITARHAATRINVPCNSPASNITASVDVPGNVTARNVASCLNVTANDAAVDVATYLQLFDEALDDVDLDPTVQCVLLYSAINQNVPAIGNLDAAADKWAAVDRKSCHVENLLCLVTDRLQHEIAEFVSGISRA